MNASPSQLLVNIAVSDRFEPDTWLDGDTPTDKVVVYSLNDTNSQ